MENKKLVELAYEAMEKSYSPYSKFAVGAALLGKSGTVYKGCNVECAAYGGSNCAERTALFKAVSEGEQEFEKIAIVSSSKDYTFPCGICRQVLAEFGKNLEVILDSEGDIKVFTLNDLIPHSFTKDDIK